METANIGCQFSRRGTEPPDKSSVAFTQMSYSMTKIYVGNLPFSATEDALRTLFAQHGTVESVALIMDRDTGRPRGVNEAQDKPRGGGGGQRRW
jgi:RNA recognition motif-containing protein